MSSFVLDSSAVLAVLNQEKGSEKAQTFFPTGVVSTVNLAEILTKLTEQGHSLTTAMKSFNLLQLEIIDFNVAQALKAAELRTLIVLVPPTLPPAVKPVASAIPVSRTKRLADAVPEGTF